MLVLVAFLVSLAYAQGKAGEAKLALSIKSFEFNADGIKYRLSESSSEFNVGSASLSLVLNIRNNDKRNFLIKGIKGNIKIYGVDVAEFSQSYKTEVGVGQIAEFPISTKEVKSVKEVISRSVKGEIGEVVFEGQVEVEYGKGGKAKTFFQPVRASLKIGK